MDKELTEPAAQQAAPEVARLTVRLGAIATNYRTCQRLAGPAAVAGVVKADGYGLGMTPAANALIGAGCDTFFVARLEEGIALRSTAPRARIFVLDGVLRETLPALVAYRLTPVLNSLAEIALWSAAAKDARTTYDAALHVDTGMNRLGLPAYELSALAAEAQTKLSHLRIVLTMSHLACDDPNAKMNPQQLQRFREALAMLPPSPASLASTGGVLLGKDYAFDMVRPGIGLYGGNPHAPEPNPFAVAAVLTARILQLRRVDRGQSVGYGATYAIERPSTLATVAAGYADGLMRAMGNRGQGAIAGLRAPFAGRVSMDLITLDVTNIPATAISVGADVELLGDIIPLEEVAASAGTANYEVLTSLSRRIPRHYVGADA
jgi:alanine racemase